VSRKRQLVPDARWSGMSPGFWLGLQERYDLEMVAEWKEGERIKREVTPLATTE